MNFERWKLLQFEEVTLPLPWLSLAALTVPLDVDMG